MAPAVIPVYWLGGIRLCWDQNETAAMLVRSVRVPYDFEHRDVTEPSPIPVIPGVVVCPARYWTPGALSDYCALLAWVVVILTSDEESTFNSTAFTHPNAVVWTMTPKAGRPPGRHLGEGSPPETAVLLDAVGDVPREYEWVFAGQVTHRGREACAAVLRDLDGGVLVETDRFQAGVERPEYLRLLASAKVAPAPGGPATPDSFRVFEALDAGAVPVVDGRRSGYWRTLFGADPPFPALDDWRDFPGYLEDVLARWPDSANRVGAWWAQYRRNVEVRIAADLARLAGPPARTAGEEVTVIVPTSPIPSHPSTDIIEQTVESVRARLPDAELFVAADGIPDGSEGRAGDYAEYLRRLVRLCKRWRAVPYLAGRHLHQAGVTASVIDEVRTPAILFVEHDTPLSGDIDWDGAVAAITGGDAHVVRFHHESRVLEPHAHLMLDKAPQDVHGVPMLRTVQWSQRPHLASTAFYREILARYFGAESSTMIEDVMHGVVQYAWRRDGICGWALFRLYLYAEPNGDGSIQRSDHLDGRAGEPMGTMRFAYDGPTPAGAPAPSDGRVD